MKTLNIKFYSDPGHGWAAVKKNVLVSLNIQDKISSYSYMRGNTAYLEEHCDAGVLISALKSNNISFNIVEKNMNGTSPIRSYDSYRAS